MSAVAKLFLARHSEAGGLATVSGVEIFAVGQHREDAAPYTANDLKEMVDNFQRFSTGSTALVKPPLAIGHEEEQPLTNGVIPETENTGIPGFGRVSRIWTERDKLKADFANVPQSIARLINGRAYSKVSAEVYDEPPQGVPGTGKMLRRVSLLGGELPQIKTLADMPLADYSEGRPIRRMPTTLKPIKQSRRGAGYFQSFAEVVPMDRAQLEQQALACGLSQASIDALKDDAVLGQVVMDLMMAKSGTAAPPPEPAPEEGQMADNAAVVATPLNATTATVQPPTQPGMGQPAQVILKYTEQMQAMIDTAVAKLTKPITDKVAALDKFAEDRYAAEKKSTIKAELDALVAAGKVLPAELDAGLADILHATDSRTVHKFTEAGKTVQHTLFDRFLGSLKARPVLTTFADRVRTGKGGGVAGDSAEGEVEKVRRFAEERLAPHLKATGKTPASFVAGFVAARAKMPELTAQQYGVPADGV